MQVAIRDLKSRLSQVLARAQAGEVIEVTSHKRLIARIVGIPSSADANLRGLIGRGDLSWKGGKPRLDPPVTLAAQGTSLSQLVLEDRG